MTRTMIGLRLPPALLKAFDKWWKRAGFRSRTHAIEASMIALADSRPDGSNGRLIRFSAASGGKVSVHAKP